MEPRPLPAGMLGMLPHSSTPAIAWTVGCLSGQGLVRPEAGTAALGPQACAEPQQNTESAF